MKVFVAFGRHPKIKNAVVDFLKSQKDIEPIVLEDLPAGGNTIIEQLEKVETDKAIVIFTGDDTIKPFGHRKTKKTARQNVIFEFGYFIAKLGRQNVIYMACPSCDHSQLSDCSGLLRINYRKNSTAWKKQIAKELGISKN